MIYTIIRKDYTTNFVSWESVPEEEKEMIRMEIEDKLNIFNNDHDLFMCKHFMIDKYSIIKKPILFLRRGIAVRNDVPLGEVLKKLLPERNFTIIYDSKYLYVEFIEY